MAPRRSRPLTARANGIQSGGEGKPHMIRHAVNRIARAAHGPFLPPSDPRTLLTFTFLLLAAVSITLIIYQPGYMSHDSLVQYAQARGDSYNDWHPPAMARLWHYVNLATPGPFGMLLFHAVLYWGGLALIFACLRLPLGLRVLGFLSTGFLPPVFGLVGMIWKDLGVLDAAIMACGLIMAYRATRRAWLLPFVVLCLFYVIAVRYNAAPLTAPLFAWMFFSILGDRVRRWRAFAGCLLAACAATVALFAVTQALSRVHTRRAFAENQIQIFDLVGTSVFQGRSVIPDELLGPMVKQPVDIDTLRKYYDPSSVMTLTVPRAVYQGTVLPVFFVMPDDPSMRAALTRAWLDAIRKHPMAYLRHRWAAFRFGIGLAPVGPRAAVIGQRTLYEPYDTEFRISPLNSAVTHLLERLSTTPLYRVWVYIAALLILAAGGMAQVARGRGSSLLGVSLSALFFAASWFFVQPINDFRFELWTIAGCLIAAWVALAALWPRLAQFAGGGAPPIIAALSPIETDTLVARLPDVNGPDAPRLALRRSLRDFALSAAVIALVLFGLGMGLEGLCAKTITDITEENVELNHCGAMELGETLRVRHVNGVEASLSKRLAYRFVAIKAPDGPTPDGASAVPASENFSVRFPSFRPPKPGAWGMALEIRDGQTRQTRGIRLPDITVTEPGDQVRIE